MNNCGLKAKVFVPCVSGGNNVLFTGSTNGCSLLDKFVSQEPAGQIGKQKLTVSKQLAKIEAAYLRFDRWWRAGNDSARMDDQYDKALEEIAGRDCTADEIDMFAIGLNKFKDWNGETAGYFLSALINSSTEREFTLHVSHLEGKLLMLGYMNRKNVTVYGDCEGVGAGMESGTLVLHGNISRDTGLGMKGGRIVVHGDTGICVGGHMTGGCIIVMGSAGDFVGGGMRGGRIEIGKNAGEQLGHEMKFGHILVRGSVGDKAGAFMEDGRIIILGDSGNLTGWGMQKGSIYVRGYAKGEVGERMAGGKLTILGRISGISYELKGGEIWQGKMLVVRDGHRLWWR
ncbi:Tungsten-containing formylmethanofuran dehydrogenase 2 subunit C [uncultured archaeon]|nr:Tungsten-containing formylmethanofuran dehydrogenase 2 subunit C [uncultured archaeon]